MYQNVEAVTMQAKGMQLFGTAHVPKGATSFPWVIFVHGFASNRMGQHREAYHLSSSLAKEGIASLRLDLRGCGDSDGWLEEVTLSDWIEDIHVAIAWVEEKLKRQGVKRGGLALLGRSLGGALSLVAASLATKTTIRSIALVAPLFNTQDWVEGKRERSSLPEKQTGKAFDQEFATFSVESSLAHLNKVPLLQVHAEKDAVLSSLHRQNYEVRLKPQDQFHVRQEADHFFYEIEHRMWLRKTIVQWFKETLC